MTRCLAFLSMLLAVPATASADDLAWSWEEGQHRRFFLQTGIKFQTNFPFGAAARYDFSAQEALLTAVADCQATALLRKGKRVELTCTFDDVAIMASSGNQVATESMVKVLDEWDENLSRATYTLMYSPQGRSYGGELSGLEFPFENRRTNQITTAMEALVDRLFAPLDAQLPKAGSEWSQGWVGKNFQSMMIPTASGGNGANKVTMTVDQQQGDDVDVVYEGGGTIMEGVDVDTPKSYSFESQGILRFDQARGTLVAHAYRSVDVLNASAVTLPGRQNERTVGAAGGNFAQGARDPGQTLALESDDAAFLSGGAYDPNTYLEFSRMYLIDGDATPNVGPTGPLVLAPPAQ